MKSTDIQKAYIGSTEVEKIYMGSDLIYQNAIDYSKEYFTIEPLANGTITFSKSGLSYSTDKTTWTSLGTSALSVSEGINVYLKGTMTSTDYTGIGTLSATSNINVSGNIMSLLYSDNYIQQTSLLNTNYIFGRLFYQNTYLISAEDLLLPATTLANQCYYGMFYGCSSLTTPPELPATTLSTSCYNCMFYNCRSLTIAPELPATTLTTGCYNAMFYGCSSLIQAPDLLATTLAENCYNAMFRNCSSLNYIKCLATDISATNCTSYWLWQVASSGTFVKNPNMSSWSTGINGIPSGWTQINAS